MCISRILILRTLIYLSSPLIGEKYTLLLNSNLLLSSGYTKFMFLEALYLFCLDRMFDVSQELEGRPLRVNSGPPPPKRENSSFRGSRGGGGYGGSFGSSNKLHIGNLPWVVDDDTLESLFSEHGKVMEAKVVYDRESGRSKGFGFVTYSCAEEASSAMECLNGAVSLFLY